MSMTKYYKSHPKHLFWKDIDANEYLRIMPIAKTINVLYVIKNGEEQGAVMYDFILYFLCYCGGKHAAFS